MRVGQRAVCASSPHGLRLLPAHSSAENMHMCAPHMRWGGNARTFFAQCLNSNTQKCTARKCVFSRQAAQRYDVLFYTSNAGLRVHDICIGLELEFSAPSVCSSVCVLCSDEKCIHKCPADGTLLHIRTCTHTHGRIICKCMRRCWACWKVMFFFLHTYLHCRTFARSHSFAPSSHPLCCVDMHIQTYTFLR